MPTDEKIDQVIKLLQGEIERNDQRFVELMDADAELKVSIERVKVELKQEINKVYTALSEDIQIFAEDQAQLKRRVDKIERKIA